MGGTGDYVVVLTYETLGSAFVQVKDDNTDYELNGLRRVTRTSIAEAGTDYDKTVGTSYIDHQIDAETAVRCYLASYGIDDTDSFRQVQEVWLESGVLSISESHRYGDSVEVYSVEGIKLTETQARSAITDLPATAKFYGSRLSNYEGLQTTLYEFFTGSGVISTSISYSYNNKLTRTTIVSIDETPSGPVGSVLIDSKAETRDEFILYTYTFVEGQGVVSTNSSSKYNGELSVVTVTSINEVPTVPAGAFTKEALVREEDGYLLYSTTYISGQGEVGRSTDSKYNGTLTVTSVTSINETPTESGALISASVQQGEYGTVYTYTYADGTGEIGTSVDQKYNNTLTLTTKTSLNGVPSEDGALIRADQRETDYGTIYTYTFADGEGEIGRTVENKYDGNLILTTVTSLNEVPDEDGYLFRSDSSNSDYGTIYTYTFADGEGMIAESESEKYLGKLKIKSETYLNDPTAAVPSGYTLISQDSKDGDFGVITTITSAEGDGEISNNEEVRNDGSIINIFTILGNTPPTEPAGSYLMETSYQAADGYDIYTYYYYTPPTDYEVDVSTTWNKPSTLSWDRDQGFHISDVGSTDTVTGTAEVTFSTTPSSAIAITDLSVGAVARESVKYADGTRLVRSTTFTNTYYNSAGASFTGGDYLGEAATVGAVSSSGQDLPSGTVTLGWESVPYFYAGGATIWKTTHTTGVI
jgi:hypothetical protein